MRCPVCDYKSTKVIDSRLAQDGMSVRRRRECEKARCAFRFSTQEEVELMDCAVIKRNGRREPYLREKLESGLKKSLEKRPYTQTQFHSLVHDIEREIQKIRGGEVTSEQLGEIVMGRLRGFDKVAYIRFASVYRSFEGLEMFEKELKDLSGK